MYVRKFNNYVWCSKQNQPYAYISASSYQVGKCPVRMALRNNGVAS
jgi:hypothetical protein